MSADAKPYSEALRYHRLRHGWSQKRVADQVGTNEDMVSRWERGISMPSPYYRERLCKIFQADAEALGFLPTSSWNSNSTDDAFTGPSQPPVSEDKLATLAASLHDQPVPLLAGDTHALWHVPYQRNPLFTGREELLTQLHDLLNKNTAVALTQTHALCGLGGIGKTQTVLEYAYRYRDEYQAVLWVKADTREHLLSDFLSLATVLNLPERAAQDQAIIMAAIKQWMQHQAGWLLIFDNADDLTLVRDFLPPGSRGHVLLTTRAQAMGRLAQRIDVEVMRSEVGALFLLRRAGLIEPHTTLNDVSEGERNLALALARELGGLPLALDQAGAYMEESPCSLADYTQLYQKERFILLSRRGGIIEDHPEPVATTWSLSFEQVQQTNPAAADLLRCCAFLDPDAIPEELILAGAQALGPVLAPLSDNRLALNEAMGTLWKYSLVRRNLDAQIITVHRLVQAVLQETMAREEQRYWSERVVHAVQQVFPARIEIGNWQVCQRLLSQALTCATLIEQWDLRSPEAAHLLNQLAYYLREQARYLEAEAFYKRALMIREHILGMDHLDTAQSYYNLGRLFFDQGKHAPAEEHYRCSLEIRERLLGSEHPDVACCLNSLALLYWQWGERDDEAERLYQRALPIFEATLGAEHPQTAHCWNNLALLYVTQGKYVDAESIHRRVLAIRERMLPAEHLDTAQTLQNLACLYVEQRNEQMYGEAERLHMRSLDMREHLLGPDHPQVARSLNNLALLYEVQGRYRDAEPLYQRALMIREQTLGQENPKTITTRQAYVALQEVLKRTIT
jgi:tetratricopeptide (TPR) repeat protein/transcriptional regulator with XRE-family HTH domain